MSFLSPPPAPAAPPPPPSYASGGVQAAGERARLAAAAAAGKTGGVAGFGRTVRTSAQGAEQAATAKGELKPVMRFASLFGGG